MEKIEKIKRPGTLQTLAYDKIKGLLITGQLELNGIYSANHFAEILGVSRTPVREALLQLATEGLLISVQGRGFKIKEFSEKEVRDFFEARKMIEAYVIEHLVGVMTEKDLLELDESLEVMEENAAESDTYRFLEADNSFHMNFVHRYNNLILESIMENIRNLISIFGQKALGSTGRTQDVINEHQSILQALHQKDMDKAVKSMNYHLNTTEKNLFENLKALDDGSNDRIRADKKMFMKG
ncbi:MAG: GntR family transcriptional regulator [Desulfatiglandales bacterium]|nr:GntR family transcriptional regulator [Desulfatiglandales bacterium]